MAASAPAGAVRGFAMTWRDACNIDGDAAAAYPRHCEEPLRRSNPGFLLDYWIASHALAMTWKGLSQPSTVMVRRAHGATGFVSPDLAAPFDQLPDQGGEPSGRRNHLIHDREV